MVVNDSYWFAMIFDGVGQAEIEVCTTPSADAHGPYIIFIQQNRNKHPRR